MGGMLSRCLVGLGVLGVVIVGCADGGGASSDERLATSRQAVFASNPEFHTGHDLPDKTLVLTFDDGPSGENNGAQTRAISSFLKTKGIKAVFFAVGSCIARTGLPSNGCGDPSGDVDTTIRQVFADGHLLANHTTTHRSMTDIASSSAIADVVETDADLQVYKAFIPWNHWFFRAPQGNWSASLSTAADSNMALKKYVGPIYWYAGGDTTAGRAADWDSFSRGESTKTCGDKYLAEIRSQGKGIVLMHDQNQYPNPNVTTPANPTSADYNAKGNTYLLVRYVVEALEAEGGWKYTTLDEVPSIKAAMPKCSASCATCNGATSSSCLSCAAGRYLAQGSCATCSTCGAGSFAKTACSATADTVCQACATCGAGTYRTGACSATTDTACATCSTCPAGKFQTAACTSTADTACEGCTVCAPGTFRSAACTSTTDTTCSACSVCPAGAHAVTACSATTDTVCATNPPPLDPDAGSETETNDAGGGTSAPPAGGSNGTDAGATNAATDEEGSGGCNTAARGADPALALAGLALVGLRRRRRMK